MHVQNVANLEGFSGLLCPAKTFCLHACGARAFSFGSLCPTVRRNRVESEVAGEEMKQNAGADPLEQEEDQGRGDDRADFGERGI
jgi:hypothetical protein